MSLTQLVYAWRPFGFDAAMLNGILSDARRLNPPNDITGALICRADLYLQMLEGPTKPSRPPSPASPGTTGTSRSSASSAAPPTNASSPTGAMRDDPARSWMSTEQEVASGALELATEG